MNARYIALHRKSPDDPIEYTGPFVSQRMAQEFLDTLPAKFKVIKSLMNPTSARQLLSAH